MRSASRPVWGPGPHHLPAFLLVPHEPPRPSKGRAASPPSVGAHEGGSHPLPDKGRGARDLEAKPKPLLCGRFLDLTDLWQGTVGAGK